MIIRRFEVMVAGDGDFPEDDELIQELDDHWPRFGWSMESVTELDVNDVNTSWNVIAKE